MKLYISPRSPYSRIPRIILRECGALDRVEEITVKTRVSGGEFFAISPVARIPALVDQGRLLADTRDMCQYLQDKFGGHWFGPETPLQQTYRHIAMGLLDEFIHWFHENRRPPELQDPKVATYEHERAANALRWLDANCYACRAWNFTGIVLVATIEFAEKNGLLDRALRDQAPDLLAWIYEQQSRPSVIQTRPD